MDQNKIVSNSIQSRATAFKNASNPKIKGAAEASRRLKGVTIAKPIVYGNVARYLGHTREEDGHTHQWTVFLRSYDNEDMSVYVRRVQFKLHDSYAEPTRVFTAPPYSITETGWGEFEIAIKIFFVDNSEKPIIICHFLKLFDREKNGNVKMSTEVVNSEFYDELVFTDPTVKMHHLLSHPRMSTSGLTAHIIDYEEKKKQDLQKILIAKEKVKRQIAEMKARIAEAKGDIVKLKLQDSS